MKAFREPSLKVAHYSVLCFLDFEVASKCMAVLLLGAISIGIIRLHSHRCGIDRDNPILC